MSTIQDNTPVQSFFFFSGSPIYVNYLQIKLICTKFQPKYSYMDVLKNLFVYIYCV